MNHNRRNVANKSHAVTKMLSRISQVYLSVATLNPRICHEKLTRVINFVVVKAATENFPHGLVASLTEKTVENMVMAETAV